jgi:hypothetical protein
MDDMETKYVLLLIWFWSFGGSVNLETNSVVSVSIDTISLEDWMTT